VCTVHIILLLLCVCLNEEHIFRYPPKLVCIYLYTTPTDDGVRAVAVYFGEKHFVSGWILFTRVTHSLRNRHNTVGRKQTDTRPTMWNMCRRRRRRCRDGGIVTGVFFFPVCLYITFSVSSSLTRSPAHSLAHTISLYFGIPEKRHLFGGSQTNIWKFRDGDYPAVESATQRTTRREPILLDYT